MHYRHPGLSLYSYLLRTNNCYYHEKIIIKGLRYAFENHGPLICNSNKSRASIRDGIDVFMRRYNQVDFPNDLISIIHGFYIPRAPFHTQNYKLIMLYYLENIRLNYSGLREELSHVITLVRNAKVRSKMNPTLAILSPEKESKKESHSVE